jgi:hypothetical protein
MLIEAIAIAKILQREKYVEGRNKQAEVGFMLSF